LPGGYDAHGVFGWGFGGSYAGASARGRDVAVRFADYVNGTNSTDLFFRYVVRSLAVFLHRGSVYVVDLTDKLLQCLMVHVVRQSL
jgi:hypothetical protein